jgi:UDP-N-acetylmuramoyl-tripeptide--D-alanyl-D-alanine ligase
VLRIPVSLLLKVTGGELLLGPENAVLNGVSTDSRDTGLGAAFIALPGERVDGHEFTSDAIAAGARALVITQTAGGFESVVEQARRRDVAIVRVSDGLRALQQLAAYHRKRLNCAVVGVTGSTGKTTTKDFLDAVLGRSLNVVSTKGNRNNELGVPLTVLAAGADTEVLVCELGMRGLGQIAELAEIAAPTHGLVTNVGSSHVELLGSEDAIAEAKGELVEAIEGDGFVFLNGDDAYSDVLAKRSLAPVTLYGLSERCAVRAEGISLDAESHASFRIVCEQGSSEVTLPIPGRHNAYNALAAASVALSLGIGPEGIAEGLAAAEVTEMRMQVFTSACGIGVINDAYNANPTSMKAALDTLAAMRTAGRRVAVLGDMAELGSLAELAHFRIGEHAATLPIDILVTVGEKAARIGDGAKAGGADPLSVRPCASSEEASEVLDDLLEPCDTVLVKASRVMGLERVVEGIVNPRV